MEFLVGRYQGTYMYIKTMDDQFVLELSYSCWLKETNIKLKPGQTKKIEIREVD
jgi:hypothetical protein